MTWLYTIDPGVATGIALGWYEETHAYDRTNVWIIKDGLSGFLDWFEDDQPVNPFNALWVSERFVLRDNDFVANTEPLKIEGALETLRLRPTYQLRTDKALCKDEVLKEHGLWVTGKMVGHSDGRDANDATIHALAYLKKQRHLPTLKKYWA